MVKIIYSFFILTYWQIFSDHVSQKQVRFLKRKKQTCNTKGQLNLVNENCIFQKGKRDLLANTSSNEHFNHVEVTKIDKNRISSTLGFLMGLKEKVFWNISGVKVYLSMIIDLITGMLHACCIIDQVFFKTLLVTCYFLLFLLSRLV